MCIALFQKLRGKTMETFFVLQVSCLNYFGLFGDPKVGTGKAGIYFRALRKAVHLTLRLCKILYF
jgi:hypothetical protein